MKKIIVIVLVVLASIAMSGCYWQHSVDPSEAGVKLDDGISISGVVGPGRYSAGGWYSTMRNVDLSVKTIDWADPDLVTSDKQPIGLSLAISYHRDPTTDCIVQMYKTYNSELFNNERMETLVRSRVPNSAKENTAKLTLDKMLVARDDFATSLETDLSTELKQVCVVLDTVQVANIAPDAAYMEKLKEKARVIQDREIAAEAVKTADENLKRTKAETEIQLELARRQNEVNKELAKTYDMSPAYLQIKRLELLKGIMGPNAKFVFVPEGSDLSVFVTAEGSAPVVPLQEPK